MFEFSANNVLEWRTKNSVTFLGEMQTKFYCLNVGTIAIFDKKMFKFLCHIPAKKVIKILTYQDSLVDLISSTPSRH